MKKINYKKVIEIFHSVDSEWKGDNTIQGLDILRKYFNKPDDTLITGADHDIIFSVGINEAIERGLTEEDATKLAVLNWSCNEDGECFSCFV